MQRLPLPGPSSLGHNPIAAHQQTSDFALRDILERWAGSDETLKVVMMAKSEEDRLKQEVMRLEIRRTEMEMLKEAIRAGIQPQLIPQIFGGGSSLSANASIYTPISPSQASGPSSRAPYPGPQQIPPFAKQSQPSPRYLPKLDTANLPATGQGHHPATANPTTTEQRHSLNHFSNEAPQSAPPAGSNNDPEPTSLSFHHWRPPQSHPGQHQASGENAHGRTLSVSDGPGSPTPRKRKIQQQQQQQQQLHQQHQHVLQPAASPSASAVRRSPSRGHARHRSEASVLTHRFGGQYAPPGVSNNGIFSATMSHDRASPNPTATSHEIDAARKRKREHEGEASAASTESSIREEPVPRDAGREQTS